MKENNYANLNLKANERGDFQTPSDFADKVCKYVKDIRKINPKIIIEPTFGLGNFIEQGMLNFQSVKSVYGIEILKEYFQNANVRFNDYNNEIQLFNQNIFDFDFDIIKSKVSKNDKILILGNPPWVTNSELESLESINLPQKQNFKKLNGMDALTGKSNFDIAEYIILQLIENFQGYDCTVAMLCKNIVVKNIVRDLKDFDYNINNIEMAIFDAKEVFGVSCDASLLIFDISKTKEYKCNVYDINTKEFIKSFGWCENNKVFISDLDEYKELADIDGKSCFEWRQGIKHDCAKVMQLKQQGCGYLNGNKEYIEAEDSYIYPMLKSSDIKNYILKATRMHVVVTQKKTGEDTSLIQENAPKLWEYLIGNSEALDNRKSSIYKNSPRFSIFGIGDYSFEPYKVCVSGFYKEPKFALAYRDDTKPIMLDDTCYFIGFRDYKNALITMILLNSVQVNSFLKSIAFLDSKRPYTKDILMRIDFKKVYEKFNYEDFVKLMNSMSIKDEITESEYMDYRNIINK